MYRPHYNMRKVLAAALVDDNGKRRERFTLECKHVVVRAIRLYKPKRIFCPQCSGPMIPIRPSLLVRIWPDGTNAVVEDIRDGMFGHMSDDYYDIDLFDHEAVLKRSFDDGLISALLEHMGPADGQ